MRRDGVALLTLHRPERHNAINGRMSQELHEAWTEIKRDGDVRVAVVTGAGERALCTGFDVADMGKREFGAGGEHTRGTLQSVKLTALQNRCFKPVVTAVNGMCSAGGLHFVADSDLNIAAEHATFFDPHVKVGLVAGLEPICLARRMPLEPVLRMAYMGTAERLGAERARELGLVGEVLPAGQLMDRAHELARLIARNSPAAVSATKQALWESLNFGMEEALERGQAFIARHRTHPDVAEGARAFREKRPPRWAPPHQEES